MSLILISLLLLGSLTVETQSIYPLLDILSNIPGLDDIPESLRRNLIPDSEPISEEDSKFTFTAWTAFGKCSKVCGGGVRGRTRACVNASNHEVTLDNCFKHIPISQYDLYTFVKFATEMREVDEEICNKWDCQTTQWELESTCTHECGGGTEIYSRRCANSHDQTKCNFQSKRLMPCNTHPCFRLSEWQSWSSCSRICGGGLTSRRRSCQPNHGGELYVTLSNYLTKFTDPTYFHQLKGEKEIYYFTNYLTDCSFAGVQEKHCNIAPCPQCPRNQVYHTCLPCTRHCKALSIADIQNFRIDDINLIDYVFGCNGVCNHGCGCPKEAPYLGRDGACYQWHLMCPVNQFIGPQSSILVHHFLTQRRTTAKPKTTTTEFTSPTTPSKTAPPNTTTEARFEETTSTTKKPVCDMDIPILDHEYCTCAGVKRNMPCIAQPGEKCPFVCKSVPTCPNKLSPRLKSAEECSEPECNTDEECNHGKLCCELLCGRRCVQGE